ncbi:MAG: hypothetical protein WDO73_08285 [Ignavibacteriota bacterium]
MLPWLASTTSKGETAQAGLGVRPAEGVGDGAIFALENAADQFVGRTIGVDYQQAAGTQGISVH